MWTDEQTDEHTDRGAGGELDEVGLSRGCEHVSRLREGALRHHQEWSASREDLVKRVLARFVWRWHLLAGSAFRRRLRQTLWDDPTSQVIVTKPGSDIAGDLNLTRARLCRGRLQREGGAL